MIASAATTRNGSLASDCRKILAAPAKRRGIAFDDTDELRELLPHQLKRGMFIGLDRPDQ